MALPPLSQKITLEGAEQVKSQVRQIGDAAENAFGKVKSAVDGVDLDGFSNQFSAATEKMIAGGAVIGALAVAALKLGQKFANMAGEAAKAGSAIGRAAEGAGQSIKNFQQVGFGLQQIGLTSQEANQAMSKFGSDGIKNITEGLDKLKKAGLAFPPTAEGAKSAANQLGQLAEQAALAGQKLTPFEEVMRRSKAVLDLTTGAIKQTPEVWQNFADSINKIQDPMERIKTLSAIFGDELGRRLAAKLKDGSAALQKEFEDFNRLGLGVTDVQRKVSDEFEKAQNRLSAVREKANRDTGLALAPFLTPLLNGLAEGIADFNKRIDEALVKAIKDIQVAWEGLKAFFSGDFSQVLAGLKTLFQNDINDIVKATGLIVAAWESVTSSINTAIGALSDYIQKRIDAGNANPGQIGNPAGDFVPGGATGGLIRGPGTGTSDSILARLSNGEYVIRAAAVQHFGPQFFAALNRLRVPKFSMGGLVDGLSRSFSHMALPGFADGGLVGAGGHSLHPVTIQLSDGRSISGLFGSPDVVGSLQRESVRSQVSSTGKSPSWRR